VLLANGKVSGSKNLEAATCCQRCTLFLKQMAALFNF